MATQTPYKRWDQELSAAIKSYDKNIDEGLGSMPIRPALGLNREEITSEQDYLRQINQLTQEQIDHQRIIIITTNRDEELEKVTKMILGSQCDDDCLTFNTSFSYEVVSAFNRFKNQYQRVTDPKKKFNKLLAMTFNLHEYDTWIFDHEEGFGGHKIAKQLGKWWKQLLSTEDDELGIDGRFSRPGIKCLLGQLQDKLCNGEGDEDFGMKIDDIIYDD